MKKTNLIVCIVMVATMLLTACGGGGGGGGAKVNLVYWSMWNKTEPSAVALSTIIQKFEAKYPNITITAVWNGRENQTKVRTALGANTTIDIVDQDGDQIAGGLMQEGLLLPLDDMYNSTALDENTTFKDVFNPGVVDFYMKDGKHYLMPMDAAPVMFWYNKDAFTKAGIAQVPPTWDEFLTDLQKLKDAGYVPLAIEGDGGDYNGWYIEYIVERLKGPGFLIKSLEDKTGDSWKDPVYTQAFTMIKELWDKGFIPPESKGYQWPAAQQTLAQGKAAMELCGGWLPTELAPITGPDFNWGGFAFPAVSGGAGKVTDLYEWLGTMAILKGTKHPQEAEEFLKFVMTKESETTYSAQLRGNTRKGVEWPKAMGDGYTAASNATAVWGDFEGGEVLYADLLTTVIKPPIYDTFLGNKPVDQFPDTESAAAKNYWATH